MKGWIMNNVLEIIQKEKVVEWFKYYPGNSLGILRKAIKSHSQGSQTSGRDLKQGPPEYKAVVLTTQVWLY
jgi:hypothetical protein